HGRTQRPIYPLRTQTPLTPAIGNSARMKSRHDYTNEELGIDPARERRVIAIVIGVMVALLVLGLIGLFVLLMVETTRYEEPVPDKPFMEFSRVWVGDATPYRRAPATDATRI